MVAQRPSGDGLYKSAVLLASLGTEAAARVLSHMDDLNVEALIAETFGGPLRAPDGARAGGGVGP